MESAAMPVPHLLPHAAPFCPYSRLLLFGVRRIAVGGLNDAHAAHAFFTGFGLSYRRPLVLLRAFMAELARVSTRQLVVAPFCCSRASEDEHGLLSAIGTSAERADEAHDALSRLLHVRSCLGLTTSAQALAISFGDAGMPLQP